jgi:hypothetical protein
VKLIAFILLFSFSAYLSEAVLLPHQYITVSQTKVNSCRDKCKMMRQKKCENQNTKNKCSQSCSNCPVFASFYTNHANTAIAISPVFKIHYPKFISRFISDYSGETWKPPNAL